MMPAFAKPRRNGAARAHRAAVPEWAETCEFNRVERKGAAVGVVCAGAAYQHVAEALPDASVFKLGVTYPLARAGAARLRQVGVDALYVVEEAFDLLDRRAYVRWAFASPISPCGLPRDGELTPGLIRAAFGQESSRTCAGSCRRSGSPARAVRRLPASPGVQGAFTHQGRRHRRYRMLHAGRAAPAVRNGHMHRHGRLRFHVPWLRTGAWAGTEHRPVVAVIGDSTFAHSGLSALISTVYNKGAGTVCVLDNRTTAMTGRQGNPFNGETLQHRPSP